MKISLWLLLKMDKGVCVRAGFFSRTTFAARHMIAGMPPTVGSAVSEFELYARCFKPTDKRPPMVTFRRKRRLFVVAFPSKLRFPTADLEKPVEGCPVSMFRQTCIEVAAALELIGKRIKPSDNFNFPVFQEHLRRRIDQLPKSSRELKHAWANLLEWEAKKVPMGRDKHDGATVSSDSDINKKSKRGQPKLISLNPDDYAAKYVGHTADGKQFFLTTPFVPAGISGAADGREFLALYLFDKRGCFLSATVEELGPRTTLNEDARTARRDELLASLGGFATRRIKIAPFLINRYGVDFGFISQPPEDHGE